MKKALRVLEVHSIKSVVTLQQEFRRKFKIEPQTTNLIKKIAQKISECTLHL
jgi:sulfur relay (sulfurtransferase) DsrC/TusE family protein